MGLAVGGNRNNQQEGRECEWNVGNGRDWNWKIHSVSSLQVTSVWFVDHEYLDVDGTPRQQIDNGWPVAIRTELTDILTTAEQTIAEYTTGRLTIWVRNGCLRNPNQIIWYFLNTQVSKWANITMCSSEFKSQLAWLNLLQSSTLPPPVTVKHRVVKFQEMSLSKG